MKAPLRYIIVGTGGMGRHWCAVTLPRLTDLGKAIPVAAVDISSEALLNAQQHLGLPSERCYVDMARAFADNPADFVIVVTPPDHHEFVVDMALAHDLHVLSEKPVAATMEACARIHKKVKHAGRKMAVTMSHRFDKDKQSLESAVKSGEYGRLNYIVHRFTHNCRRFNDWGKFRHEMVDPLLVEGSVHHFDILRALAGADAATIFARTWNPPWGEYAGDSTALIIVEMANSVKCLYEGAKANASTLNGWSSDYLRAECEHGTLELDRRWVRVLRGGAWEKPLAQDLPLLKGEVWTNPLLAEMFCDWLSGQRVDHPTSIEDNIQCCAMLFAAIESARSAQPVDVQAFLQRHIEAAI